MSNTSTSNANTLDHSLLHPSLTLAAIEDGLQAAIASGAASVCVLPYVLRHAANTLMGTGVKPGTAIGYPLGAHTTVVKLIETRQALADGAEELDMVVNISAVRSGRWDFVKADIRTIVEETHASGQQVKVIFETAYLNEEQQVRLCEICSELRADWIVNSTGHAPPAPLEPDLIRLRAHAAPHVQIKAAGVASLDAIPVLQSLGATRFSLIGDTPAKD